MTDSQDPYGLQGKQPENSGSGHTGGYDTGGYPQYDQPQSGQTSGTPYDPYASGGQPSGGAPHDPYGVSQQQPYGQPQPLPGYPMAGQPAYGYPPPRRTNTMAILSLVFAFVFSPLGIVFGHMAKKQIKENGEDGDGLATAGLVLGYVFTGLILLYCCGVLGLAIFASSADINGTGY